MPLFPRRPTGPSDKPSSDGNNDDYDDDLKMNDGSDGGASLAEEEKRAMHVKIMMNDLGTDIRDRITKSDITRVPRVSLRDLQRDRAVNEPGSKANMAFMANKKSLSAWNNLHIELKSDGGAEALDVMMDGQSHRARLRELVHNSGGQQYDPHGNDDTSQLPPAGNSTREGTASRGGRSGGVAGTRGRPALTSLGCPTAHRGAANRPLDPAIDPTDSRSKYRFGHGNSQTSKGSHQDNRSRVRGSTTSGRGLGRGSTRQAVRGAIVGTKAQVTATSAILPQARQHAPNSRWAAASLTANPTPKEPAGIAPAPARRVPPFMQDSPGYNMLLDPAAFLVAIAKTKDREIFNKMIPSEPKPAPASKAAEIVAKSSKKVEKTFNDLVQSTPRPVLPLKVAEIVADLSLLTTDTQPTAKVSEAGKLAAEKSGPVSKANGMKKMIQEAVKNVEPEGLKSEELMPKDITLAKAIPPKATYQKPKSGKPTEFAKLTPGQEKEQRREERKLIRRVSTHESVFPPPFSKSAASSNEISEWTDGFPSPGMSNFLGSPEHAPAVALADLIEEGNTAETSKLSPAAQEAEAAVVGLGIGNMATSVPEPRNNVDEDLLRLRTDEADHQPVGDHRGGTCILQQAQASGAAVDLMDLDFGSISQDSLIPSLPGPGLKPKTESDTKPVETLTSPLDLPPYVDVGGVRYFREGQRPPAIPPATATGDVATIAQRTAPPATDQIITESGYTIGVPNLDLHNGHLFGDHKLARKTQVNLAKPMIDSKRSTPLVAMASRRVRTGSPVRVDQEQTLEVPLGTNTAADPRPHAIGDQNLPGRSQGVKPQDIPPISSRFFSQEGGCNAQGSTHCPQGQTMPVEANPWGTSCTAVSTAPKASNLAESQWGQLTARVVTRSSDSTTEGRPSIPSIPSIDRSSETMPSSQSGESIFCHVQAQNSPRSHVRPSTSEDIVMSSAHQIGRTAKQLSLSVRSTSPEEVNLTGSSQPPLLQENFEGRMVRLMNSQGSTGMTKFAGGGTTTESRDSLSSAKHTRGSSRSQSALGKLSTNLGISKWAAEDAATYSTTAVCSPKLTSLSNRVPNFKQWDISVQHPEGRIMTETQPPDLRPALSLAEVAAQPAAPSSQEITRSTATNPVVATRLSGHTSPTTQPMAPGRNMTSEPRIRVVNKARALGESKRLAVAQRGKGVFPYRSTNNSESSGDESELRSKS